MGGRRGTSCIFGMYRSVEVVDVVVDVVDVVVVVEVVVGDMAWRSLCCMNEPMRERRMFPAPGLLEVESGRVEV